MGYFKIPLVLALLFISTISTSLSNVNTQPQGISQSDPSSYRLLITKRKNEKPIGNLFVGDFVHYWLPEDQKPRKGILEDLRPDSMYINSQWIKLYQLKALSPYSNFEKKRTLQVLGNLGFSLLTGAYAFLQGLLIFSAFGYSYEEEDTTASFITGFIVAIGTFSIYSQIQRKLKFKPKKYLFQILPQKPS